KSAKFIRFSISDVATDIVSIFAMESKDVDSAGNVTSRTRATTEDLKYSRYSNCVPLHLIRRLIIILQFRSSNALFVSSISLFHVMLYLSIIFGMYPLSLRYPMQPFCQVRFVSPLASFRGLGGSSFQGVNAAPTATAKSNKVTIEPSPLSSVFCFLTDLSKPASRLHSPGIPDSRVSQNIFEIAPIPTDQRIAKLYQRITRRCWIKNLKDRGDTVLRGEVENILTGIPTEITRLYTHPDLLHIAERQEEAEEMDEIHNEDISHMSGIGIPGVAITISKPYGLQLKA
ncbi:Hypothetical predicted protein, partial [Paramuricea clavata]